MSDLMVLDKLRPPSVNTGALVKHAESSFSVIERWNDTRSKDPEVEDIISRVRDVGVVFFSTIKSSVEVAQRGLDVSRDAITIFKAILDGESVEEIREFIASTRKRTMTVYKKSKHVSSRFQETSIGLGKIIGEIPAINERLQATEQQALDKNAVAERRGDGVVAFQKAGIAAVGAAGTVAGAIFPPALLIMPVAVPLVILATELFRYKNKKHIKERETVARDCRDAINELRDVSKALLNLRKGVDMFSEFWLQLDTSLDELVGRVKELGSKEANRLQLRAILAIWEQLRDGYTKYLSKLKRLQQMYHLSQIAKRNAGTQPPPSIEGPPKPHVLKKPKLAIEAKGGAAGAKENLKPAAKKEAQKDGKGKSNSHGDANKKNDGSKVESPKKDRGKDAEAGHREQARPPKKSPPDKKNAQGSPNDKSQEAGPSKAAVKKEGAKDKDGAKNKKKPKLAVEAAKGGAAGAKKNSKPAAKKEVQKDGKGKGNHDSNANKKNDGGKVKSPPKEEQGKDGEVGHREQARPPKNSPPDKKDAQGSPNDKGKEAGPSKAAAKKGVLVAKEEAKKKQVEKKTVRFTPST